MNLRELRDTYVGIEGSPLPPVKVTYHTAEGDWEVVETYRFDRTGHAFSIFQGFRFDLASVPRIAWPLIAPFELSLVAPLAHDFLYRYGGSPPAGSIEPPHSFTRLETDDLFFDLMQAEGVPSWRSYPAYGAVRAFAGPAWKGDASAAV